MGFTNVEVLLVINFLSSLADGMIVPLFIHRLMVGGATHLIIGTQHAAVFLVEKLTKDFLALFKMGELTAIECSLLSSFFYYFFLAFFDNWKSMVLLKLLLTLTSSVKNFSKNYIQKTEPKSVYIENCNLVETVSVFGSCGGSIFGGFLYNCTDDFGSTMLIASCLVLISVLLLQGMDCDTISMALSQSRFPTVPSNCLMKIKKLKEVVSIDNWEKLVLKITFFSIGHVYFPYLSYILMVQKYRLNFGELGYAFALKKFLCFACFMLAPFLHQQSTEKKNLLYKTLVFCCFTTCAYFLAPSYSCHKFFLVPVLFSYILSISLFTDDALNIHSNKALNDSSQTLTFLINLFKPIMAGFICDFLGIAAYEVFSFIPIVMCLFLLHKKMFWDGDLEEEVIATIE